MTTKVCRNCHEQKEIIEFPKHRQMKDGHLNQCIVCKKDYLKNTVGIIKKCELI